MRKPDGKIVLLGDMNVGKTSLLQRYMERRFPDTVSTVGGAFYLKQWRSFNISIWDTAGEGGAAGTGRLRGSAGSRSRLWADAGSPPWAVTFIAPLSPLVLLCRLRKSPVEQHSVRLREDPGCPGRDPGSARLLGVLVTPSGCPPLVDKAALAVELSPAPL